MNKEINLKEQLYLKKRIFNPRDRSLGRFEELKAYIKQKATIEPWYLNKTWIHFSLPPAVRKENSSIMKYYYTQFVEYKFAEENPAQKLDQAIEKIATQVFNDY